MENKQKLPREFYSLTFTSIIILALVLMFLYNPFIAAPLNLSILFIALGTLYGGSLMWTAYNAHYSKKGKVFLGVVFALLFYVAYIYMSSNTPTQNGSYLLSTTGIGALAGINIVSIYWKVTE